MNASSSAGPLVRFIGIGMGKAGTTWLHDVLRQHPGLFLPERKELQFFNAYLPEAPSVRNPNFAQGIGWYEGCFADARPGQICGEFSPIYWQSANAAADIHLYNPEALLIATLRAPEDYLMSDYLWRLRRGTIAAMTFDEALDRHPEFFWDPVRYDEHLLRYLDLFGRERIEIITFDEIKSAPQAVLARLLERIGAEPFEFAEVDRASNVGGMAASPGFARLYRQTRIAMKKYGLERLAQAVRSVPPFTMLKAMADKTTPIAEKPTISAETRQRIRDFTRPRLERLGTAVGMDFSPWWQDAT